jgi:hypothetical protein
VLLAYVAHDLHRFLDRLEERRPTLKRWLPYAAELGQDDQLYQRHPDYLYPPLFLVLLRPLTYLPLWAAAMIWQFAKYAAVSGIFLLSWNLLGRSGSLPDWSKLLSIVVSVRFIDSDLGHGNINLFIAFFVVLAGYLLFNHRPLAAGLLIALASSVKVTPALWGLYLLYKRQWRAVAGLVAGLVLALEIAPLVVLTASMNHTLLACWYGQVIRPPVIEGQIFSPLDSQSLVGVTNRLFGRAQGEPAILVELNDRTVIWLQRAVALALVVWLAWSCRGRLPQSNPLAFAAEWSILAPVTLALSGYTWTGHFCLLILAHVTLLAYWPRPLLPGQRIGGALRGADWAVVGPTLAGFVLFLFTTDIITPAGRVWTATMGLPLLGALLIAAALFVLRERCRGREV